MCYDGRDSKVATMTWASMNCYAFDGHLRSFTDSAVNGRPATLDVCWEYAVLEDENAPCLLWIRVDRRLQLQSISTEPRVCEYEKSNLRKERC